MCDGSSFPPDGGCWWCGLDTPLFSSSRLFFRFWLYIIIQHTPVTLDLSLWNKQTNKQTNCTMMRQSILFLSCLVGLASAYGMWLFNANCEHLGANIWGGATVKDLATLDVCVGVNSRGLGCTLIVLYWLQMNYHVLIHSFIYWLIVLIDWLYCIYYWLIVFLLSLQPHRLFLPRTLSIQCQRMFVLFTTLLLLRRRKEVATTKSKWCQLVSQRLLIVYQDLNLLIGTYNL